MTTMRAVGPPRLRLGISAGLALLAAVVVALALAPIMATPYLPLLDAASHEARLVALQRVLGGPGGTPFYELDTLFLANMGFDLVGLVLTQWVSPQLAGRLFLGASMVLTLTGLMALNRMATGAWRALPLAAGLLAYNLFTVLGFLGYGLGVGLLFWALAARMAVGLRPVAVRIGLGAAAGVILLFCHVSAFGLYAVMLAGIGLDTLWRRRWPGLAPALLIGAELAPAIALYALMPAGGHEAPRYELPFWRSKIVGAIDTVTSGSMAGDAAFAAGALALAALLAVGRVRLNRALTPGVAMLAVLYVALPGHISGGSYVDTRLPVAAMLLALGACRIDVGRPRAMAVLGLTIAAAFVAKQAALTVLWRSEGQSLAQIAAMFDRLPAGAVILQSECHPDAGDIAAVYRSRQPPLPHVSAMAAFDGTRLAAVSWTLKGQQPLRVTAAYLPFKRYQDGLSNRTCSLDEYRTVLEGAQAVAAGQAAAGGITPTLYLLLLRPGAAGLLIPHAPLIGQTPEVELYSVTGPG